MLRLLGELLFAPLGELGEAVAAVGGLGRNFKQFVLQCRNAGQDFLPRALLGLVFRLHLAQASDGLFPLGHEALKVRLCRLEALGLGPTRIPTLGMTIYYAIRAVAMLRGMWWWLGFPILTLTIIFVGFFLIATGLDEIANPRLRGVKS